ncbi:MAG: ABC transporter substrate-binding protein, partial [Patescibacteria group bacterium]|nr:ABC transporter substrate-binding protein [Patescibacteria group bacterium]
MKKLVFFSLIVSRFITRYFKKLSSRQRGANFAVVKQNQSKSPTLKLKNLQQPLLLFFGGALVLFLIWFFRDNLMPKPVVSEGIIGLYTEDNLPPTVTSLLSRPLVNLNQSGQPVPDLAEKWQSTDEAKLYTLTLKPNLFWNDQTPLKSSDIKFNLEDIQVSYPDDQTIIFKLADSFNPFPVLLNDPVFKQDSLIGDGLYNVSSIEKNKSVITKMVLLPADKNSDLPEINVRFYPDEQTAKTSFALGEINSLLGVSDTGDLIAQPAILINQVQIYNKLVAIFYNTKDPILSDKNLRKALNCVAPNVTDEE